MVTDVSVHRADRSSSRGNTRINVKNIGASNVRVGLSALPREPTQPGAIHRGNSISLGKMSWKESLLNPHARHVILPRPNDRASLRFDGRIIELAKFMGNSRHFFVVDPAIEACELICEEYIGAITFTSNFSFQCTLKKHLAKKEDERKDEKEASGITGALKAVANVVTSVLSSGKSEEEELVLSRDEAFAVYTVNLLRALDSLTSDEVFTCFERIPEELKERILSELVQPLRTQRLPLIFFISLTISPELGPDWREFIHIIFNNISELRVIYF